MLDSIVSEKIRRVVSKASTSQAVTEIASSLQARNDDLVLCFAGPNHDPGTLQTLFQKHFEHTTLIACRTAGEITPDGYYDNTVTAVVLPSTLFTIETTLIENLQSVTISEASDKAINATQCLENKVNGDYSGENCFAMLLIDGLSQREEIVSAGLNHGLGNIQLFGGSSADDINYENAWIYYQNKMCSDVATLIVIHTKLPFKVFKTEHFSCGTDTYVTTKVIADNRIVLEVDGYPAAQWYADTLGLEKDELTAEIFSHNPITVQAGGKIYVRSIQSIEKNGGLRFYCAIDEGMVLHIGERGDLLENLKNKITQVSEQIGGVDLLIGCDCMLRNLEAKDNNLMPELSELFKKHNSIGFATFGEQHNGIHINQTFTGIAIGTENCAI